VISFMLWLAIITGFLQGLSKIYATQDRKCTEYPNLISYLLFYDIRK
jgi:hypothetical protein